MTILHEQLEMLNEAQRRAVTAPPQNLLVLAGAGSGKTRVLVNRTAWLMQEHQASPYSILSVTFTNKAANEMRGRLESLLNQSLQGMWVGTFHGLAHKLLRLHWKDCELPENFQVIDSEDQLRIIRNIFKTLSINEERWQPKKAQGFINKKKDDGLRPHQLGEPQGSYEQVMHEIYQHYENYVKDNGLVDFAELLLRSYELLDKPDILAHYQARFEHFLVDEFQDTNTIQYNWLRKLALQAKSITIVGDDDQSIYGWRGARIENLQRFENDYPNTQVLRLEQNYRSTNAILTAANTLIMNNDERMGKTLWTDGESGEPVTTYGAFNEIDESLFVVRKIRAWIDEGGNFDDIGILYRSNAQSRVIEEALMQAQIPYSIYGGLRFFERAEIKDALAYLRLSVNLSDNSAFDRIINVPPRGIGQKTVEKIRDIAIAHDTTYWEGAQIALQEQSITGKARLGLLGFVELISTLSSNLKEDPLAVLVSNAITHSGLLSYFKNQKGEKAQSRAENLEELVSACNDFTLSFPPDDTSVINEFLAHTALDGGETQQPEDGAAVQLMTIHSAKGLEFPLVFLCGLEEGLFPHHFSKDIPNSLEEERRLCYVGITRAMKKLYMTYAKKRRLFGRDESRKPSRFIHELPSEVIEEETREVSASRNYPFRTPISDNHEYYQPSYAQEESESDGFSLGQRVNHVKFGAGTVINHEGQGERARIHVHFDNGDSKWLVLAFAKLEPV